MIRSRSTTPANPRTLAWSVWLYRCLLLAYPARFRAAYGSQMIQVFRDGVRQAQRERGLRGVGRLWLRTLADLAVSALAERCTTGGNPMSRWTPARFCGFVAMLGGAIWIGYVLFAAGSFLIPGAGGVEPYGPNPIATYIFDAAWLLFPLALMGLLMRASGHVGVLPSMIAWLGFTIALLGGVMLLVGNLGTTYMWSSATYVGGVQYVHLSGSDLLGENIKLALYWNSYMGYPVLGLGLALAGLVLWRTRALPVARWNIVPLGLGLFVALQYFFTDMGAPSLLRNTGTPGLLVMIGEYSLFALAWATGWIVLGRMLWVAAPAPTVQVQPAAIALQTQSSAS